MKRLFIVISLINLSVTSGMESKIKVTSNEMIDVISDCSAVVVRRLYFFEQNINVVQDPGFNMPMKFFVNLSLDFTFLVYDSSGFDQDSMLNYVVISHDSSKLYEEFEKLCCNVFTRILVVTTVPFDALIKLVNYLNGRKFVYVTFLIIDDGRNRLEVYQRNNNCGNCKQKVAFDLTGFCGSDGSLVEVDKKILPFSEIVCPAYICKLRFIRVDYGATREELYNYSENGTELAADSYGGCVLETFADFYNISVTSKEYVSNYTWDRTVKAMISGRADVGFGPTLPYSDLVTDLQKGTAYTYEEFLFIDVVHKSTSSLSQFFMPLDMEVWICVAVAAILFLIFTALFKSFENNVSAKENLKAIYFLAMFFNQYIRPPSKSGIRVVVGMWLLYALLMNAIYNCNFVSSLIKVKPKDVIRTFDELRKSGRKFGGPDVAKEWLKDPSDSKMMDLYNRYEIVHPDDVDTALRKWHMVVAQTDYMIFKTGNASDFYLLEEKIVSYPLLYYMPRGHPFFKFINQFMERIRAGDIPLLNCPPAKKEKSEDIHKYLALRHLKGIFQTLVFLNFISFVFFLLEYFTPLFDN